jgi:hypothetical protein
MEKVQGLLVGLWTSKWLSHVPCHRPGYSGQQQQGEDVDCNEKKGGEDIKRHKRKKWVGKMRKLKDDVTRGN